MATSSNAPLIRCLPLAHLKVLERAITDAYQASSHELHNELRTHGAAVLEVVDADVSNAQIMMSMFGQQPCSYPWKQLDGKDYLLLRLEGETTPGPQFKALKFKDQACLELEGVARCALRALATAAGMSVPQLDAALDQGPLPQSQQSSSFAHASLYHSGATAASPACQSHIDRSIITLVMSDQEQGLQVLSHTTNQWMDVPLGSGKVAVLVGYGLGFITKGMLQPVKHRVVPAAAAAATAAGGTAAAASAQAAGQPAHQQQQEQRLSLAFNLCFHPAASVIPSLITQQLTAMDLLHRPAAAPQVEALTGAQLMARFEQQISYSIHGGAASSQQPPAIAAIAAQPQTATAVGPQRDTPPEAVDIQPASKLVVDLEPASKRPRLDPADSAAPSAAHAPASPAAAGNLPACAGTAPASAGPAPAPSPAAAGNLPAPAGIAPTHAGTAVAPTGAAPALPGAPPAGAPPAPAGAAPVPADAAPTLIGAPLAGVPPAAAGAPPVGTAPAGLAPPPAGALPAHAGAAPPPAGPMPTDTDLLPSLDMRVSIIVRDQGGGQVLYKVKRSTPMGKVINAYCAQKAIHCNSVKFVFFGHLVDPDCTPDRYEMEDGDAIDVLLMQVGN